MVGGRYGLGSKDFTPAMAKAVFDNLLADKPRDRFTVGITGASAEGRGGRGCHGGDQVTVCWHGRCVGWWVCCRTCDTGAMREFAAAQQ